VLDVVDLSGRSPADLPHALHDVIEPVDVRLRDQPAVSVDRQLAAELDAAARDERPALAARADG
jgi:hypothetical protein